MQKNNNLFTQVGPSLLFLLLTAFDHIFVYFCWKKNISCFQMAIYICKTAVAGNKSHSVLFRISSSWWSAPQQVNCKRRRQIPGFIARTVSPNFLQIESNWDCFLYSSTFVVAESLFRANKRVWTFCSFLFIESFVAKLP